MGPAAEKTPAAAPARAGPQRRPRRLAWAAALLLLAAVAAWLAWERWGAAEPLPDYATAAVRRGTVEDVVSALGNLQPRDYVDVGTQVSGQLRQIHFDRRRPGADGRPAGRDRPHRLPGPGRGRPGPAREPQAPSSPSKQAQLTLAQQQLTPAAEPAKRQRHQPGAAGAGAGRPSGGHGPDRGARAQIGQTESDLRANEANLGYTKIYAPMAGTVVSITAKQGQTLNANQRRRSSCASPTSRP